MGLSAAELAEQRKANAAFHVLFNDTLLLLAYAYRTPGTKDSPNPYYQNSEVLILYINALEYSYSRGVTEMAWLPDINGRGSKRALSSGLVRPAGDLSTVSLRLAGYIQSVFLMRESLENADLLAKYRAVVRNLVVNHGRMYPAFFSVARSEAGIDYTLPLSVDEQYHLNADGVRVFVDYFWPYFLLIEDATQRSQMTAILTKVIAANIAVKPGTQDTIKPDGTGFHHRSVYMGAYTPYTLEAFSQLLYMAKGIAPYRTENVQVAKLALASYRVMVQKYSVSDALRGRFVGGSGDAASIAISKAMAFLAHPDGMDDFEMKARFKEFFDPEYFWGADRRNKYPAGVRGVQIRGLGIYRLIADLQDVGIAPAEPPSGVWIKPYAAAAFFRRGDWLVTAKGFSQYFWDYEGPLNSRENSFGQNWAYGLLQVFSAGSPISARGSGYDLRNGWDWYHVPGTTASHYPIEERTEQGVRQVRTEQGIQQRDTHRNRNTKTFVGGVSLGEHGFFVQDLEAVPFTTPTDLRARKTYFFIGDRVLAMGTDILGGTRHDPTHTTIFQTRMDSAGVETSVNGTVGTGLVPAGKTASLIDSVGNSYFLATSTAELVVTSTIQRSMTVKYEPTVGAFVQAYLNHGIRPQGDSYQYVLIPADADGIKLRQLAANPGDYYQVMEADKMHLVRFPGHGITAYAFYELIETSGNLLVRSVNLPAAVITKEQTGGGVRLAASVPDIGWEFDKRRVALGLSGGTSAFVRQEAKTHDLQLILRGEWCVDNAPAGTESSSSGEFTTIRLACKDGMSSEIALRRPLLGQSCVF